ncbi:hypothetical protein LEP1GSC081_4390 [Leptospira kirschneri str. H1]|uniref:Uncharacterized protein n=1 Tax=Leptospira kirschneri str. H1 TaxID=1049966 RepID=A0A0E2BIH7_9LEPT|nr:hypothetical protein LEP1GSC081_4390 [Leptospira kirschneri str. H1]
MIFYKFYLKRKNLKIIYLAQLYYKQGQIDECNRVSSLLRLLS